MPPRTTRSTRRGGATAASKGGKQQQSISFGTARVTRPGVRAATDASKKKSERKASAIERASATPSSVAEVSLDDEKEGSRISDDNTDDSKQKGKLETQDSLSTQRKIIQQQHQSELAFREHEKAVSAAQGEEEEEQGAREKLSAEEEAALKVPEAQIKRYWAGKEAERTTRRVHQEGMGLDEKILREFDMSSQFGNCIGIPRTRRWRLAHDLGLDPPLEVLAVLVRRDSRAADPAVQRAYPDELMASRFEIS